MKRRQRSKLRLPLVYFLPDPIYGVAVGVISGVEVGVAVGVAVGVVVGVGVGVVLCGLCFPFCQP